MNAKFKLDKHVKKYPVKPPVKPNSLLPVHDFRMRFCAKRLKWLKHWGLRRKIAIEKEIRECYGHMR